MPVNSKHKSYTAMSAKWRRCRDVAAGQDSVYQAGALYLPKLKEQSETDYKAYQQRTSFYNASFRTIVGLVGMLFRKPPKIEVPESITELLKNVDGAGEPFQLFVQDICENTLTVGRVGVLVDYPAAPADATQADAQRLNLRPTMQLYTTENIINWKTGNVNNQTVLTMVVLQECVDVVIDEFECKEEERWRVLDLVDVAATETSVEGKKYRQRVFKRRSDADAQIPGAEQFIQDGDDIFPTMNNAAMSFSPFVIMGTDDVSVDVDDPPLIDLVDVNLSHYRTTADYSHGCHFTGLPTLFLAGFKKENPDDKIYIGSEAAIVTSNENAKAQFVEIKGEFLALEKKLDREEKQMAVLGARMLEPQIRGVESADAAAIHRKGEESVLSSMAQAISLGVSCALRWFVEWAGMDASGVVFELNRDFYPAPLSSQMLTALLMAWQQGGLSDQELFDNMKAGEVIAQDVTIEDHQAQIADRQLQLADQQAAAMLAQQQ